MTEAVAEQMSEWSFPDVSVVEKIEEEKEVEVNVAAVKELEKAYLLREETLLQELALQKTESIKKSQLIETVMAKLQDPLSVLDKELIELLHYIIKKTVKSIIYREMKADPKLVNRIIKELSELINAKNGLLTVLVSSADYNRLVKDEDKTTNIILKETTELQEGDVIVKSNCNEIRAVLNDRINQVLGIKYA